MTQTPSFPLVEHPAFRDISEASLSKLKRTCRVLRFDLGGQLCDPNAIPARILVLLKARRGLSVAITGV